MLLNKTVRMEDSHVFGEGLLSQPFLQPTPLRQSSIHMPSRSPVRACSLRGNATSLCSPPSARSQWGDQGSWVRVALDAKVEALTPPLSRKKKPRSFCSGNGTKT